MRIYTALLASAVFVYSPVAMGQEAIRTEIESSPTRVTAYRGRAWVERTVSQPMQPGLYQLVFTDLPSSWQSDSVQAKISGDGKVLGIDTVVREVSTPPNSLRDLDRLMRHARQMYRSAQDELLVTESSIDFIQQMMAKSGEAQNDKAGSNEFDIKAVQAQMEYFSNELKTLYEQRSEKTLEVEAGKRDYEIAQQRLSNAGGTTKTQREAVVEVLITSAGPVELTLGYLVLNANWTPRYDVRGDLDTSKVNMEYGAQIFQQSGEDWNNVTLVLSTAQPAQAANPPSIGPVYVDVFVPPPPRPKTRGSRSAGRAMPTDQFEFAVEADSAILGAGQSYYGMNAAIQGGSASVTFTLPRPITVETNAKSAQRTRIAEFEAEVDLTFVAMPVLTEQVYLRGRFNNTSDYQLLPGQAGIFIGGDYVGETKLASAAPGSQIELFFGADPAMKATRTMLTKNTGETGVFGGWLKTSYQFVLNIDNGSNRTAKVELWDRRPISRSEEIEVSVNNLSLPLSTNPQFVADDLPRGLMRWDVTVPASSIGDKAFKVSYDLLIERKEGVRMTPLPD
ncbi:MAG: mucoidy inhibitor MuiA family protein [Phycisphaerales bacterium]|nr:mucoidy inhibitor MuiA family protein [Phycisphaerales bacterium]